ncbi:MAG TPA: hypothetical protein VHY22_09510 [Chthoniobacteraceae bacterium]|nr:hypothetical protein [Chthoniobacteraceae bacterium]
MRWAIFIVTSWALCAAGMAETALDALKELPKDQAARIARIEARDGTPSPDRWYILTDDTNAENGVHEFVVSNGEIVASRSVSQFADHLDPDDMLGDTPLTIDSDKAAKVAREYAEANGAVVTSMNYELKKDGPDAAPAWTVSCVDDKGNKVGQVVITAGKGNVVSHDGFALEPAPEATPSGTPRHREEPHFDTYAKPEVASAEVTAAARPAASPGDDDNTPGRRRRKKQPPKQPNAIGRAFQSVGHTLEKINPF